ncbi:MAG TPA: Asp-tRNA(Asn)/Glu-tRNA(Gln) amidotransferase subunit GatC [Solirubrobacteraceae bacterium]|nr:Asp-tRNA(Asn)/Glu-tRNA(Gln) amidotransferase subunit GatC [Solirubrobacteraceae bacterium]
MIDRAQVEHVARLARLALDESELEGMARELSGVLEHIEKISELDLAGVSPTSHVVEVTAPLRADEPHGCLTAEQALDQAPATQDGGFLVPSPGASPA